MGSLNHAQEQAVNHDGGHLLIIAGPGTGKTHTLTARIARIASSLSTDAKILAITFTNKAAQSMKERLSNHHINDEKVFIGTFHKFCLQLLRRHIEHTSLPKNFTIAAPKDIADLTALVWPHHTASQRNDFLERISFIKLTSLVLDPPDFYNLYQRALRQKGLLDFDDILREALVLFDGHDELVSKFRKTYCYIFIDEYQDTNAIGHELLKIWGKDGVQVTAIGDPNQAIYGFRGANSNFFKQFSDDFANTHIIALDENYRSSKNVLAASQQVITPINEDNKVSSLKAMQHSEGKIIFHEAPTDRAEAEYIAHQIEKKVGGLDMLRSRQSNFAFGDFAILYRLHAQAHVIKQALDHLGIPCQEVTKKKIPVDANDEEILGEYEEVIDMNIERVNLLSLHAAKGLEFPIVFIIGCEDGILPLDIASLKSDIDEERRLLYVGMTRAKLELYLTYAKRRQLFGQKLLQNPSPFLADIKEELKAYEAARIKKVKPEDSNQLKLF